MNRQEQYKLIEQHFPDAIMNPEEEFVDQPGIRYDLTGVTQFCGCGDPESAAEWLRDLLMLLDTSGQDSAVWEARSKALDAHWAKVVIADEQGQHYGPLYYIINYWITEQEWTEHGGCVPGWTTDKGKAAIEVLNLLIESEREEES